jgi:hypothetical protein
MTPEEFVGLVAPVTGWIKDRALDDALDADLNRQFPAGGAWFECMLEACRAGIAAGWMCNREGGGIKYGRVVKPGSACHGFSVDVVEMDNLAGPHHRHPGGNRSDHAAVRPGKIRRPRRGMARLRRRERASADRERWKGACALLAAQG